MAWARNRYGVFPESGFAGDERYPESFMFAGEERDTVGCNQTGHEVSEAGLFKPMLLLLTNFHKPFINRAVYKQKVCSSIS